MIPAEDVAVTINTRVPRVGGGDPNLTTEEIETATCSPRRRG